MQPPQSDTTPLAAYVFKTATDRFVGTLNYFRIFSGGLKSGSTYYNADKGHDERFGQLLVMRGKEQIPVPVLHAGDTVEVELEGIGTLVNPVEEGA